MPQMGILDTKYPWGKFCRKKDGSWERQKHRRFSLQSKTKITRFFPTNHILFMSLSIQLSCLTTVAASFLQGEREKKGEERGLKEKKKKSEIPAMLPGATRGTFVPFFLLHRFGVETSIRGKPGSSAFLRAVHPESKKIGGKKEEVERTKERNDSSFGHPDRAAKSLCWTSALGFIFEVNFQSR